jgi:hypothetical protein
MEITMQEKSLPRLATELPNLTLASITQIIKRDWKAPNFAAKPYLNAMGSLSSLSSEYGADSSRTIVLYFLSNAASWRGEVAKAVKKELNRRLKEERS